MVDRVVDCDLKDAVAALEAEVQELDGVVQAWQRVQRGDKVGMGWNIVIEKAARLRSQVARVKRACEVVLDSR